MRNHHRHALTHLVRASLYGRRAACDLLGLVCFAPPPSPAGSTAGHIADVLAEIPAGSLTHIRLLMYWAGMRPP